MPELETQNGGKVVIGYPDSAIVHDPGKLTEISTSGEPEKCYAFRYLTNATEITSLFSNLISETEEFVFLKNGWISRQIVYEGNIRLFRYKIGFGSKFFAWDCTSDPQNPVPFEFSDGSLGENLQYKSGLYLITSPSYADIPAYKWANMIPENYTVGSFEESPFLLYRYGFEWYGPYTAYWNVEEYGNTAYPRYLTNYGSFSDRGYYGEIVFSSASTGDRETWLGILGGFTPGGTPEYGEGSRGGGFSKPGGGNGSFDDSSASVTIPTDGSVGWIVNMCPWKIKESSVSSINAFLNSQTLLSEGKKATVLNSIVMIKNFYLPVEPDLTSVGKTGEKLLWPGGIKENEIQIKGVQVKNVKDFTIGTFEIPPYYGNFLDYRADIQLFLPSIGFVPLNPAIVVGKTVKISGKYELISSTILYFISVIENGVEYLIESYSGAIGEEIPFSSTDYTAKNQGLALMLAGITTSAGAAVSGNLPVFLGGMGVAFKGAIQRDLTSAPNVQTKGISSVLGNLSPRQCFLVITRHKWSIPENYGHVYGYPCNMTFKMEELTGYTEVEEIHLDGFPGTKEEKERLMAKLKKGVVIRG